MKGAFRRQEGERIAVRRDLSVACEETLHGCVVGAQSWEEVRG